MINSNTHEQDPKDDEDMRDEKKLIIYRWVRKKYDINEPMSKIAKLILIFPS